MVSGAFFCSWKGGEAMGKQDSWIFPLVLSVWAVGLVMLLLLWRLDKDIVQPPKEPVPYEEVIIE
jgi:hypothetical protein